MSMPAPSKPLGALDFSQVTYGNKAQRFTAQTNLARLILAEKLQAFQEINALAKITFAEGNSTDPDPVWIDARSTPVKLLDSAPKEVGAPAFELTWPPERFENLAEGRDDPQTAVFMSAVPTTGDYPLAIRFADLMTPNPTAPPKTANELPLEELPKPTEDIDQVKRDLRRWGYGLLKNALTPEQVAILKKASQEQAAGERNAGVATFDGGPKKPNQRIWNIFNKGEEFLDLLNHPLIDEVVPWYLGCDNPLLWSYNINIARPGGTPQVLHWDQGIMGHGRTKAVALNISWLLCDFTETNGGTRIFPGSHNQNVRPRNVFSSEGSIACEAPAGTAMIFEGRIWHGTGQNTESSGERPCILSLFTHPAVRPKENALLALSWEAEDEVLSERHKSLAALRTGQAGVGGALGEAREGIIVKRPRPDFTTVGKLRAPHDDAEVAQMLATGTHANNAQSAVREAGGLDKQKITIIEGFHITLQVINLMFKCRQNGPWHEVRVASVNGGSVRRDGSGAGRQRGRCEPAQGDAGGMHRAQGDAGGMHRAQDEPGRPSTSGGSPRNPTAASPDAGGRRGDGGGGADDNATRPAKNRSDSGIAPPISSNSPVVIRRTFSHYRHKCIPLSYQACGLRALRGNRSQNGMMGE